MAVVVCGPEGSGTRILHKTVQEFLGITEAIHLSVPNGGEWWHWEEVSNKGGLFIVITRRPDVTALSLVGRHPMSVTSYQEARSNWETAIRMLAMLPRAYWITYEAFLADPERQARNIAAWLKSHKISITLGTMPEIIDNNAKWLSFLEGRM